MATTNTLCKKLLNVKGVVIQNHDFYTDDEGVHHLRIYARPSKHNENRCPHCSRKCPGYDSPGEFNKIWRGLDWGGILVEIEAPTHRVSCPEHGVVVADIPWAYPNVVNLRK